MPPSRQILLEICNNSEGCSINANCTEKTEPAWENTTDLAADSELVTTLTQLRGPTQHPNAHDAVHAVSHVVNCMHLCEKVHRPVLRTQATIVCAKPADALDDWVGPVKNHDNC